MRHWAYMLVNVDIYTYSSAVASLYESMVTYLSIYVTTMKTMKIFAILMSMLATMGFTHAERKCVECTTGIGSGCTTPYKVVACKDGKQYCSASTTWTYASVGTTVKTATTRGCIDSMPKNDECSITSNNVTCSSTCDFDGCNTYDANGGTFKDTLYCVQCEKTGGNCDATKTACPSQAKYCKSTVNYLFWETPDVEVTGELLSYRLQSVVRTCATEDVTTKCTETNIGTSYVKSVTCEETCQEDGCNKGWPARPKCVKRYGGCPEDCRKPYQKYCYVLYRIEKTNCHAQTEVTYPTEHEVQLGCSHYDRATSCIAQAGDPETKKCYSTCTTDGCNAGEMAFQAWTIVLTAATIASVSYSFM